MNLTITLPNGAQITLESAEPEFVQEVIRMALSGLPLEGLPDQTQPVASPDDSHALPNGSRAPEPAGAISGNGQSRRPTAPVVAAAPHDDGAGAGTPHTQGEGGLIDPAVLNGNAEPSAEELRFIDFCRTANPSGDMRRVVVAAEGAQRFLGVASVDQYTLEELFTLAGWPRPNSLVQTLRNSARATFQWLERVPGRMGFYTVTVTGRQTALPDSGPGQPPGLTQPSVGLGGF